ncbi:hypothetical protein LINPERHAP1_LOCUS23209 [Linum perenne]
MVEAEMDFHDMKRKQLQALCKKHGISANKTNREMANLLASALKVNEPPSSQNVDEGEIMDEEDETEFVRQPKRVRFSPDVETREYEPTARKQRGRVTRARAKVIEANNEDVVSKNLDKDALQVKSPQPLRKGRKKLVQDCVEPEKPGRRAKRNTPNSITSEPMLTQGSNSCEDGGRITRLRVRSQSTCNTSAVNKEAKSDVLQKDSNEVIAVIETAEGSNRYPSRQKSVANKTVTFKSSQQDLKGETTKCSRNSNSKVKIIVEASDLKGDNFQMTLAPDSRRSRRKTVVSDTIAGVDQVGDDETMELGEIPKQLKRNSSRQKSRILRKVKFEGAEKGLKGKASKVSSNSQLEVIKDVEASIDLGGDTVVQKVSAPVGNLRRSSRKRIALPLSGTNTVIYEDKEGEVVEVEDKVIKGNFSGRNRNNVKELKRKATELVNDSKLEVIMEVETSAEFEENIDLQKASITTGQLRRSSRKTVMFSSLTPDSVAETLKAGGTLSQFSEQVIGTDVQPIDESQGQPGKLSRNSSSERRETTDVVDPVVPRSQRRKQDRDMSPVIKRGSMAGKAIHSTGLESKISNAGSSSLAKPTREKPTDCLSVSTMDDNKSTNDMVAIEESQVEAVLSSPSGFVLYEVDVDIQGKLEGTQSVAPSKLVGSATHQGLPSESAINEKILAETAKESNADFVPALLEEKLELDSTGRASRVPLERKDANISPISASKFSEYTEASISELPIAEEETTVNIDVSSSKAPTTDDVNRGLTVLEDTGGGRYSRCSMEGILRSETKCFKNYHSGTTSESMKEISGSLVFKPVESSVDKETTWSSSKPASMNVETNPSGNDCDQVAAQGIASDGYEVGQIFRSLETTKELNHGNLGLEPGASDVNNLSSENQLPLVGEFSSPLELNEGPEREELLTEVQHCNEDHSTGVSRKAIADQSAERLGHWTPIPKQKNEEASNTAKLSVDLEAEILTGRTERNLQMDETVHPLVDLDTTTCIAAERVVTLKQNSGDVPQLTKENPANTLFVIHSTGSGSKDITRDAGHSTSYTDLKSPGTTCSYSGKKHPQVICSGDASLFSFDASKQCQRVVDEENHHISSVTEGGLFEVQAVEMETVPCSDSSATHHVSFDSASKTGEQDTRHCDYHVVVEEIEKSLLLSEPRNYGDRKLEPANDASESAAETSTKLIFTESETFEQEKVNLKINETVQMNSYETDKVLAYSQDESVKPYDADIGSVSRVLNDGFESTDVCNNLMPEGNLGEHQEITEEMELLLERCDLVTSKSLADVNEEAIFVTDKESSEPTMAHVETLNVAEAFDGMCYPLPLAKDVAVSMNQDSKINVTQILPPESVTFVREKTELMIDESVPMNNTMAVLNQGGTISGLEDSWGRRLSKDGEVLMVKDSAKVLDTNEDRDFSLEDNEKGKDCSSSELNKVQTGETSVVKSLVVPGSTLYEPGNNSMEANGAYHNDISSQKNWKTFASEEDIDAGSTVFTEWEMDLIRGNESQHEAVESDWETMNKLEGKSQIPDMDKGTNVGEVVRLPADSECDKLVDMEEHQEATTETGSMDVSEGSSKELPNKLKEAATEEDSLTGTDGLNHQSFENDINGFELEDDSPITTSDNASSSCNARQEPETEVLDSSTQSSAKAIVDSSNLVSNASSFVQEVESMGLHLLFERHDGEADVAEADQLALESDEMSKRASSSPQITTEAQIGEMKDGVSAAQDKQGKIREDLTIINTAAAIEQNAANEGVTDLFNPGKECCMEAKIVNFSISTVDEMEDTAQALVSDEMSKKASSLPQITEENTRKMKDEMEVPDDLTIFKENATKLAVVDSFNLGKMCTPTNSEEELAANRWEPEETEVIVNRTKSKLSETVDSTHLASNDPSTVDEVEESMGLDLLFEGQDGEADTSEADQLGWASVKMSKETSSSPQISTEAPIGDMISGMCKGPSDQEMTNNAASIEENAVYEAVIEEEMITNLGVDDDDGMEEAMEESTDKQQHSASISDHIALVVQDAKSGPMEEGKYPELSSPSHMKNGGGRSAEKEGTKLSCSVTTRKGNTNKGKLMMMQRTTGKMFAAKENMMKENVGKMSAPAKSFGGKRLPLQDIGTRE